MTLYVLVRITDTSVTSEPYATLQAAQVATSVTAWDTTEPDIWTAQQHDASICIMKTELMEAQA